MENQPQEPIQSGAGQTGQNTTGTGQSTLPPEYIIRVNAAFEGKDGRRLLRAIKPQFPNIRTADLNMKLVMIQDGVLIDDEILRAVEAVSIG